MTWFEFQDIMFLVKCFQKEFTIADLCGLNFKDSNTRADHSGNRLQIQFARNNYLRHFYFVRITRLWTSLLSNLIDLSMSFGTIKDRVQKFLVLNFERNFDSLAFFIWFARVINVSM